MNDETNGLNFLRLIGRSPDGGGGWRDVTPEIWDAIVLRLPDGVLELVDLDTRNRRVRISDTGHTVLKLMGLTE